MMKITATLLILVTIITGCAKEEDRYCFKCKTEVIDVPKVPEITYSEHCGWTEDEARHYEGLLTYTDANGLIVTTTCKKKNNAK